MSSQEQEVEEAPPRQAPDEVAERKVSGIIAGGLAITLGALVVAWLLLEQWGQPPRAKEPPPAPRTIGILEQSLIRDTERGVELRDRQYKELATWGWVDRDAGIAKIPVASAIDILAAAPLPPDRALEREKEDAGP
jgi:hypothetical protein